MTSLWGPVVVYAALIFAASSISQPPMPGTVSDHTLHAWAYAGLSSLLLRALSGGRWRGVTAWRALLAAVVAAGYGLTDELHQLFVPGRFFDLHDLLADGLGASAAAAAGYAGGQLRGALRGGRPRSSHDDIPSPDLT